MTVTSLKNKDFSMYYILVDNDQGQAEIWYTDSEDQARKRYQALSVCPCKYLAVFLARSNEIDLITLSLLPGEIDQVQVKNN